MFFCLTNWDSRTKLESGSLKTHFICRTGYLWYQCFYFGSERFFLAGSLPGRSDHVLLLSNGPHTHRGPVRPRLLR